MFYKSFRDILKHHHISMYKVKKGKTILMNHLAIGNEVYLTQKPTTCEGYSIIEKLMLMFQ